MSVLAPLLLVGCGSSGGTDSADPYAEADQMLDRMVICDPPRISAKSKLDQKYDLDANEKAYANGEIGYSTYMELITRRNWEERMLQEEFRACTEGKSFVRPRYEPMYTDDDKASGSSSPKRKDVEKIERPTGVDGGPMVTDLGAVPLGYVSFEWDVVGKQQKSGACKSERSDLYSPGTRRRPVAISGPGSVERPVVVTPSAIAMNFVAGERAWIEIYDCDKNTKSASCSIVGVNGDVVDEQSARVRSNTTVRCEYEVPQLEDLPGYERYSELASQVDADAGQ